MGPMAVATFTEFLAGLTAGNVPSSLAGTWEGSQLWALTPPPNTQQSYFLLGEATPPLQVQVLPGWLSWAPVWPPGHLAHPTCQSSL